MIGIHVALLDGAVVYSMTDPAKLGQSISSLLGYKTGILTVLAHSALQGQMNNAWSPFKALGLPINHLLLSGYQANDKLRVYCGNLLLHSPGSDGWVNSAVVLKNTYAKAV